MRESYPLQVTIRYMLMFVHRRDLVQSSVSRTFAGDRVRERNAKSHLYTLIQKNPVSLILGVGGADKKWKGNFWFLHTRVRERVRGALSRSTTQSERTRQFQATTCSARAKSVGVLL